jgi:hypothetical protein
LKRRDSDRALGDWPGCCWVFSAGLSFSAFPFFLLLDGTQSKQSKTTQRNALHPHSCSSRGRFGLLSLSSPGAVRATSLFGAPPGLSLPLIRSYGWMAGMRRCSRAFSFPLCARWPSSLCRLRPSSTLSPLSSRSCSQAWGECCMDGRKGMGWMDGWVGLEGWKAEFPNDFPAVGKPGLLVCPCTAPQ